MSSHEAWLDARHQRNAAAVAIARAVVAGEPARHRDVAAFKIAEADMDRISDELDGKS